MKWWGGPDKYSRRTGVRLKNPLNVKAPRTPYWQGQIGRDSRGHAKFKSPAHGVRAAALLLRTYWRRHRLRTVAAILSRWAPVTDSVGSLPGAPANSPKEYAEFVEKRTGLHPMEALEMFWEDGTIRDKTQLKKLLKAMAEYEIGAGFNLHDKTINQGLDLV